MVFADSSALIALGNQSDHHHAVAVTTLTETAGRGSLHVSNYVLAETLNLLGRRLGPGPTAHHVDAFVESRTTVMHWIDEDVHREALALFRQSVRKGASFIDCTSFALMRRLGLTTAFTFDRDFAAAGFEVVPHA